MNTVQVILAAIAAFPQAITAVENLYNSVKDTFSATDQATIDKAFEDAKASDARDTAQADVDLDEASKV